MDKGCLVEVDNCFLFCADFGLESFTFYDEASKQRTSHSRSGDL